jgi:hypothetical protein
MFTGFCSTATVIWPISVAYISAKLQAFQVDNIDTPFKMWYMKPKVKP